MAAKTIRCTQCGAPLEIHNPRAKTTVCGSCGAQLDLTSPDYAFLGVVQREPITHPLKVGMHGKDEAGLAWRIVGHLRYEESGYYWDEYLLQAANGESAWIQYDDGKFSFYEPKRLTEPLDPKKCVGRFELGGKWHYAHDMGAATVGYIEGELTWKARVGDTVKWIDAGDVGIEFTEREIEVFDVTRRSPTQIATFFGIDRSELKAGSYTFKEDGGASGGLQGNARNLFVVAFIVIFLLIAFGSNCSSCNNGGTGTGYRHGSYGYPHTYHRGFHSGGGFHFGK